MKTTQSILSWKATIVAYFGSESKAKAWINKAMQAGAKLDEPKHKKEKH